MRKSTNIASWILSKISRKVYRDNITGDFEELYNEIYRESGMVSAYIWYVRHILRSLPDIINSSTRRSTGMFKNYIMITLRNIKKNRVFSFINIAGLSVGMTCFILIMLYIKFELSYENFNENVDDIYRVVQKQGGNVWLGTDMWNNSPGPLKTALEEDFPEILHSARIRKYYRGLISYKDMYNIENRFIFVDPELFEIFTYPLITGDPVTALNEPMCVLLTQEMAEKYFGDENPVGKILGLNGKYEFRVTGVLKNTPANSHFNFDFLASFQSLYTIFNGNEKNIETWGNNQYKTYIRIRKDINLEAFKNRFPIPLSKYSGRESDDRNLLYIQPLKDIHLYGHMNAELEENSDVRYVYFYTIVAFLIMIIACLNYMNLSTARSAKRSREVGIRKAVGAGRKNIIRQFLGESIVLSFFALGVAVLLVELLLPVFSTFVERELTFGLFNNKTLLLSLLIIAVLVGILSGIYPALFLSSFKPGIVIKNISGIGPRANVSLRNSLVVFQFIISIVLIFCTIAIYEQLNFIHRKDLGYNKDLIVIVDVDRKLRENYEAFKNELIKYSRIIDISVSQQTVSFISDGGDAIWENKPEDRHVSFYKTYVDHSFLDLYGLEILEGRNFSLDITTDIKNAYILNKTAVEAIGWEVPIGKSFTMWEEGYVIGVVDDFHFHALRSKIKPLVLTLINPDDPWNIGCFSIKISPDDISGTLKHIEKKYREFSPEYPLNYSFLDEKVERMYKSEQRLGKSFMSFTVIAVFVACLGLFGLALSTAECRTREIGIRKVLGASIKNVISLLGREFLKWITVSVFIAWPIGFYAINKWLQQNFAYRIEIGLKIFVLSMGFAILITVFTVVYQSLKAALSNPVDSLRYE